MKSDQMHLLNVEIGIGNRIDRDVQIRESRIVCLQVWPVYAIADGSLPSVVCICIGVCHLFVFDAAHLLERTKQQQQPRMM